MSVGSQVSSSSPGLDNIYTDHNDANRVITNLENQEFSGNFATLKISEKSQKFQIIYVNDSLLCDFWYE